MQFKYVNKTDGDIATMLLYGSIGGANGINGDLFAAELNWLATSGAYKKINVRINSIGGNVIQGMSIYMAIRNAPIKVDTYVDYLAASMGGIIALAGDRVYMAKNGIIMIHNPSNPDGSTTPEELAAIAAIKDSLVAVYAAKTGSDAKFISDMMDRESWINAENAKQLGMIDSIFNPMVTAKAVSAQVSTNYINQISAQIIKNQMENTLEFEALKGEVDKLKASAVSKDSEIEASKKEIEALKKQLADKDAEIKTENEKKAVEYVENLVKSGKIKKEKQDSVLDAAKQNLNLVMSVYDAVPAPTVQRLSNVAASGKVETGNDRESWTYKDWETKDSKGLQAMFKERPDEYKELLNNWKQENAK